MTLLGLSFLSISYNKGLTWDCPVQSLTHPLASTPDISLLQEGDDERTYTSGLLYIAQLMYVTPAYILQKTF